MIHMVPGGCERGVKKRGAWCGLSRGYDSPMASQLRMYTIKPGKLDDFCRERAEQILPFDSRAGFV